MTDAEHALLVALAEIQIEFLTAHERLLPATFAADATMRLREGLVQMKQGDIP